LADGSGVSKFYSGLQEALQDDLDKTIVSCAQRNSVAPTDYEPRSTGPVSLRGIRTRSAGEGQIVLKFKIAV
jgi:hypothetical protein